MVGTCEARQAVVCVRRGRRWCVGGEANGGVCEGRQAVSMSGLASGVCEGGKRQVCVRDCMRRACVSVGHV